MVKDHRDAYALVPEATILSILRKDAQVLANDADRNAFVAKNWTEYLLAVNTWMYMVKSYSTFGWSSLLHRIVRNGLKATVMWCLDAAQLVVSKGYLPETPDWLLLNTIYHDVVESCHRSTFYHTSDDADWNPTRIFLTLLRYLKRMSPRDASKLEDDAIASFFQNQRRLKGLDRGCKGIDIPFVIDLIKDEVSTLDIEARIRAFSKLEIYDLDITSGVAYDSGANLNSKLKAIYSVCPDYFSNIEHFVSIFEPIYMGRTLDHVRLAAVPKSIKAARTIAMENTYRQATAKRMFKIWQDTLPVEINLHDQSQNQRLARRGALDGSLATIDLHAASDDVRYSLVRAIYPQAFCEYLDLVRPQVVDYKDRQPVRLTSWATMGNSLTFILESEIFYLIAKAAIHFHNRHFDEVPDTVSIYGDDIIVPSDACNTVIAFLEVCGFRVNEDKTFSTGGYRESCGAEYWQGEDWQSIYFPRFPIANDLMEAYRESYTDEWKTNYTRIVELQHRLYEVSYEASLYLVEFLRSRESHFCAVQPGAKCNAVWALDACLAKEVVLDKYVYIEWSLLDQGYIPLDFAGIVKVEDDVELCNPDERDARLRQYIFTPQAKYNSFSSDLLESYLYMHFLHHGPTYASAVDKYCNVSEPSIRQDTLHPTFGWKLTEI